MRRAAWAALVLWVAGSGALSLAAASVLAAAPGAAAAPGTPAARATPAPATAASATATEATTAPERCLALKRHGHNPESHACYQALLRETNPYLRAEGYWGLGQYSNANEEFRKAVAQAPATPSIGSAGAECCTSASTTRTPRTCSRKHWPKILNNAQSLPRTGAGERRRI